MTDLPNNPETVGRAEDAIEAVLESEPDQSTPYTLERHQAAYARAIETACEVMHDAYGAAAVGAGRETQEKSRKPWADVPEANKATMRVAVSALIDHLGNLDGFVPSPALPDPLEHTRRFFLHRNFETVTSSAGGGTGIVAVGVEFPDGTVALRWLTGGGSTAHWASVELVRATHCHAQSPTDLVWID